MSRVQKVNFTFLATLVLAQAVSYSGVASGIGSYTGRLLFSQLILVFPSLVYFIAGRQSYAKMVCFKKMKVSGILWTALFFLLTRPLLSFVNAVSMLYSRNYTASYMTQLLDEVTFLPALAVVALVPCILEESVYRGVFYNEYRKARPRTAIFLSALMFGLVHGNLNQFTYAFVMGVIFALMIEATDSILSTMIIHFLINGSSVAMLYLLNAILPGVESLRDSALAAGDTSAAEAIERALGTSDISINSIMNTAGQSGAVGSFADVMRTYGMSAIIFGVLAFFVYRQIAAGNGRWQHIKAIFLMKSAAAGRTAGEDGQGFGRTGAMPRQDIPGIDYGQSYDAGVGVGAAASYDIDPQRTATGCPADTQEFFVPTGERLFTWPLIAGLVICVGELILNELVLNGVITL